MMQLSEKHIVYQMIKQHMKIHWNSWSTNTSIANIIKTTSNECLSLTNEMNELKVNYEKQHARKRFKVLNTSYEQIRSLEMKNKTIADKHLIENMMNKEFYIKNIKKNHGTFSNIRKRIEI